MLWNSRSRNPAKLLIYFSINHYKFLLYDLQGLFAVHELHLSGQEFPDLHVTDNYQ